MTRARHPLSYELPPAWESALERFDTWLIASGHSPQTRKLRRAHLRSIARTIGCDGPGAVTSSALADIVGNPRWSSAHRDAIRGSLRKFYAYCTLMGIADDDPSAVLPTVKVAAPAPRPATDAIWVDLLAGAGPVVGLAARLAAEVGMRRAEVAQSHTNDLVEGVDGVQLIVHGKGGRQRVVPISSGLAAEIRSARPAGGFVFPGRCDGHISPHYLGKLISAGMPRGWSMHKLRHRFATRAYAGTGDLRSVQELLGHSSVATTQRYTAVSARELRAAADAATWRPPVDGE